MSTLVDIDRVVEVLGKDDLILLHAVSTYPADYEELNLRAVQTLLNRYQVPIGYSGHETDIPSTVAATVLWACVMEHFGGEQAAKSLKDFVTPMRPESAKQCAQASRLC